MSDRNQSAARKAPIPHLRWWIGLLLFIVTFVNYVDRQTLAALSPYLKEQYNWSNDDYQFIVNAFTVAYTIMQSVVGRLLDVFGTRLGIAASVAFYSLMGALTAIAGGKYTFGMFRFLLGAGEAANNPGGAKAVSEWFPVKERALAVALYNSGCAAGGFAAPFIAVFIYNTFASWRPAFVITATMGFVWLILWLLVYRRPEEHPRISDGELAHIQAGRAAPASKVLAEAIKVGWLKVLRYRQTWGLVLGRFLLDPFWFFVTNWFALFLRDEKHFSLTDSALGSAGPIVGALLGSLFAGTLSSMLVRMGWQPGKARRVLLMFFGPSMAVIALTLWTNNYWALMAISAYCMFAYNCCGTMFLTLPTDVFHTRAVGTVMGLAGTSAGIGTIITTKLIGTVTTQFSYAPVIITASIIPTLATVLFVTMVRANRKPDPDGILMKF
jgi:ACS family hexuronate transporter-like MFS transporter